MQKKKLNSKSIMSLKTNNKNKKIKYYKKISNFKFQKNFSTFKKFLNEAY